MPKSPRPLSRCSGGGEGAGAERKRTPVWAPATYMNFTQLPPLPLSIAAEIYQSHKPAGDGEGEGVRSYFGGSCLLSSVTKTRSQSLPKMLVFITT